jgi:CO/xanthine dehydrogenase Mo-binding subunit
MVVSDYAHARIIAINTAEALAVPGVVAVLTAKDMPDIAPTGRSKLLLARDRVQFVGHPVALVLAESETAADDGADQVWVDYEPLPAAITTEEALAEGAPLVWPEGIPTEEGDAAAHGAAVEEEEVHTGELTNVADETSFDRGDVDAGFAQAEVIVERTFTASSVHHNYLDTTGVMVQPDLLTGGATVWSSTQGPYGVRQSVAEMLGVTESDVRVIPTAVGGGFGGKFGLYEVLVAAAAKAVGRPVRLLLTRMEELLTTNPAPALSIHLKIGATKDGELTALDADIVSDGGLYSAGIAGFSGFMLGHQYQFPNLRIRARDVLTFKPSTGAYRAPGQPQGMFALESVMDEVARKLNIDPLEFRLRHASQTGDPMVNDNPWADMGLKKVLETLRDHPAWQNREQARAQGRGVGIAVGGWGGGTGPGAATCSLNRDGHLQVHVNTVDISGATTSYALMAAETFGVDADKVRLVSTDTASGPFGAWVGGSRAIYTTGAAVVKAAEDARQQVLEIAAEEFEAAPEDIEIIDGKVRVKGVPGKDIALGDLAAMSMTFGARYAPIMGDGRYNVRAQSPAFCAQLAEVEIDRETGEVQVKRLVMVQDVGRAINPLAVEGQMVGGGTQGIGWALYEGIDYDAQGQLITGTWMDYALPDAAQTAPEIEAVLVENPSEHGPFGVRGVGEPPVIATAGAIGNAIADATGARLTYLPMTAPRVLEAISGNGS